MNRALLEGLFSEVCRDVLDEFGPRAKLLFAMPTLEGTFLSMQITLVLKLGQIQSIH